MYAWCFLFDLGIFFMYKNMLDIKYVFVKENKYLARDKAQVK
jgi:hypothetical protein